MAIAVLACTSQELGGKQRAAELERELMKRAGAGRSVVIALACIADARGDVEATVR
jgi:hypothetical protein